MATLATLEARGALVKIVVPLDSHEMPERIFYARPRVFTRWLETVLPAEAADQGGRQSPAEQMDDLLHRFITGGKLLYWDDFHEMRPIDRGVWELKTVDLRVFGWFACRDVFIAVNGVMARKVKDVSGMYGGFRNEVCAFRDKLDLDEPKYVTGVAPHDVLSL